MAFRAAVITFPGSNCDRDMAVAIEKVSGTAPLRVWHGDDFLPEKLDFIALPGGPERYDSILLEDGTRCYFARVVPTVFD